MSDASAPWVFVAGVLTFGAGCTAMVLDWGNALWICWMGLGVSIMWLSTTMEAADE